MLGARTSDLEFAASVPLLERVHAADEQANETADHRSLDPAAVCRVRGLKNRWKS
jgi:hypothetical protein